MSLFNNLSPIASQFLSSPSQSNQKPSAKKKHSVRRPLAFLSPNVKRTKRKQTFVAYNNENNLQAHNGVDKSPLRRDVEGLRERIKRLDEKTVVNGNQRHPDKGGNSITQQQRDQELANLNSKLEMIQHGLIAIEAERKGLTESANQVRGENEKLRKELLMREKEVTSLTKRCSLQAEKMKEATQMRLAKKELADRVDRLDAELQSKQDVSGKLNSCRKELEECLRSKQELQGQINTLTSQNEELVESLQQSFQSVGTLTQEKQAWEEERRRLQQHSDLKLQQQKLGYLQESITTKDDLRSSELKIQHLEKDVGDKLATISSLQQDISNLKDAHQILDQSNSKAQADALLAQSLEHSSHVDQLNADHRAEIGTMQSKLADSDATVELMRADVAKRMIEVMELSSSVEKLQEDARLVEGLTSDVEALEAELAELKEDALEKDTSFAELEAEILKLELEKELVFQSSKKVPALERSIEQLQKDSELLSSSLKQELLVARDRILNLEAKLKLVEEESASTLEQHELESNAIISSLREQINNLNHELNVEVKDLKEDTCSKDALIDSLKSELRQLGDDFLTSTQRHGSESRILRVEVQKQKAELAKKVEELGALKRVELHARDETIFSLQKEVTSLSQMFNEKTIEIDSLAANNAVSRSRQQKRCEELEADLARKSVEHQSMIDAMTDSINDMRRSVEWKQSTIMGLETRIEELTSQVQQAKSSAAGMEERLAQSRLECIQLREAEKSAKADRDNIVVALERQSDKVNKLEKYSSDLQKQCDALEEMVSDSSHSKDSQRQQILSLEDNLRDRSRILTDLAARNKALESRLVEKNLNFDTLEMESQELIKQLAEKDGQLRDREGIWRVAEDQYIEELHAEKNRREMAESSLEALTARVESIRQENKDSSELAKENQILKDKVRRQESYLKRKLEKEKVLRDRILPSKQAKTPGHPSRISKIPTPHSTTHRYSQSSTSANELVSMDTSVDFELDELLAD